MILNTRNLAKTIKSWTKIDTFFATSGLLSEVYNLQGERDRTECPADFEDIKWWDLRRKVKPTISGEELIWVEALIDMDISGKVFINSYIFHGNR